MALNLEVRCTRCGSEFTNEELEGAKGCPKCGTKSVPMAISDDVQIKINWHELRILTLWAERWARQCDNDKSGEGMLEMVMILAERLQKQFPNKTVLTLFSEVRDLRKKYDVESNLDNDSDLEI